MFSFVLNGLRQMKVLKTPGVQYVIQQHGYVTPGGSLGKLKKTKKTVGSASGKIVLPVETDTNRLVNFVCGTNLLKEGGEDVAIKPDSEYPDWLWNIRIGDPPKIEDLDPNTKAYWRKVRKTALRAKNLQSKYRRL